MVAMTTTLLSSMGSRVVLPKSGILMNNGVMWFDPRPNQPNSIAGGKRPLTNMSPIILRDGDRPWFAAGASGGRRILASVAQMLAFVTDFGMTLEEAAHHPRIDVSDPDLPLRRPASAPRRSRRVDRGRCDRGGGARRHADQFRLSQCYCLSSGWRSCGNQRCGVPLVGSLGSGITILMRIKSQAG